jgi:hypothetical protein
MKREVITLKNVIRKRSQTGVQGLCPPQIINLRSRRAIEISLVPLTSFGLKSNIEINTMYPHISLCSSGPPPSMDHSISPLHKTINRPCFHRLNSSFLSPVRVAQIQSRRNSTRFPARLITTPLCFFSGPSGSTGPRVHDLPILVKAIVCV